MSKKALTLAATIAPLVLVATSLALTANRTATGYQWNLGPLQVSYSDFPALA